MGLITKIFTTDYTLLFAESEKKEEKKRVLHSLCLQQIMEIKEKTGAKENPMLNSIWLIENVKCLLTKIN